MGNVKYSPVPYSFCDICLIDVPQNGTPYTAKTRLLARDGLTCKTLAMISPNARIIGLIDERIVKPFAKTGTLFDCFAYLGKSEMLSLHSGVLK